jgi:ribokinase
VPAHEVTAVDTTAAGDAFNGALAVALAEGKPLLEAVRYGMAAGALATTKRGAQPSLPMREAVEQFLANNKSNFG